MDADAHDRAFSTELIPTERQHERVNMQNVELSGALHYIIGYAGVLERGNSVEKAQEGFKHIRLYAEEAIARGKRLGLSDG